MNLKVGYERYILLWDVSYSERDIHFEADELRNDLVKRVQEAMKATERRKHTEFAAKTSSTAETRGLNEEIEMEDLKARKGKAKAAVQGST
jgi:hypothetical protein